ncbi:hypothetical protein NECAME_00318, partial [Necator americanus]
MRRSLLYYIFRILLSKLGPCKMRQILWKTRKIRVYQSCSEKQGTVVVHPLNSLVQGLLQDQIVEVSVTFQTWQNITMQTTRLMRLSLSSSLPVDVVEIGRNDAYNMFGREPGHDFVVDGLKSYNLFTKIEKVLTTADSVRLALIKQFGSEQKKDFSEELEQLFTVPHKFNFFSWSSTMATFSVFLYAIYSQRRHLVIISRRLMKICKGCYSQFRRSTGLHPHGDIKCDDSPCILDATSSFYQISSINAHLPYSAREPLFELPSVIYSVVEKMRNRSIAYAAVEETPLVMLLHGAAGSGKRLACTQLAIETHCNLIEKSCYEIWNQVLAKSEEKLNNVFET